MTRKNDDAVDVIVVGAGNAAACVTLAARDAGADVIMLESAPEDARDGNTAYMAGAMRFAYADAKELASVIGPVFDSDLTDIDFSNYTESQFFDDMFRVTEFRTDIDLCEVMVTKSRSTLEWMRTQGVRFQPSLGRQAFRLDGKFKFWGGIRCELYGGGPELTSGAELGRIAGERAASFERQMVSRAAIGRPTVGAHEDGTEEQRRA